MIESPVMESRGDPRTLKSQWNLFGGFFILGTVVIALSENGPCQEMAER